MDLPCFNPATGEQFARIRMSTPTEVTAAVDGMRAAAPAWRTAPVAERVSIVRQLQKVLLDAREEITSTISQDCGKSRQDALIELFVSVDAMSQDCRNTPRWLRRTRVSSGLYLFKQCYVERRPYGVVAILAPWNYPLLLTIQPLAAALLAGNTVVLKPSEITAATGALIERLVRQVEGLSDRVRVLHGDWRVGDALVRAGPDYVFLTGSTATGRKVQQTAAEKLIPMTAELGGKDAMLVLEDADLAAAAKWGAWGAFYNAGQTCMSVERIYVVAPVYDAYVSLAVEAADRLSMGYSQDLTSPHHLGPLTCERQLETVESHMADAVAKGARVLTGGQCRGLYYEPTVLVDVNHDMLVMRDETFGPIMAIMKVRDEAEAIRLANDSAFGLSASVWTHNPSRARSVASQLETGSVIINDTIAHFGVPSVPFGGVKQSGHGRTHGREGVLQFTQSFAFVSGGTPHPLDVATILRRPGQYRFAAVLMHLLFGRGLRQRLEPLVGMARPGKSGPGMAVAARSALSGLRAFVHALRHPGRARP